MQRQERQSTDIDKQAEEMFILLVKELAENENVTEQLKAENQMLWMHQMNNIHNHVMEIINTDLIYVNNNLQIIFREKYGVASKLRLHRILI